MKSARSRLDPILHLFLISLFSFIFFLVSSSVLFSQEKQPETAEDHYKKGKQFYFLADKKSLEKAEEEFQAALDIDENYLLAKVGLADVYAVQGHRDDDEEKMKEALTTIEEVLKEKTDLGEAYRTKANIYRYRGKLNKALQMLNKANHLMKGTQEDAETYWVLGSIYMKNMEENGYSLDVKNEAVQALQKAIELQPNFVLGYLTLSVVYKDAQDYKGCAGINEEILKINPQMDSFHFHFAYCYSAIGKVDEAIAEYEKAIKEDSEDVSALINVSILYYKKKKDYVNSERYLKQVITKYDDMTSTYGLTVAHLHLSKIYYEQELCDDAQREIKEALTVDPEYGPALSWQDYLNKEYGKCAKQKPKIEMTFPKQEPFKFP